ncbi:MAG: glycosyl transferase [Nitrospirales bacterium]|nr:MAG: glycosyl transferase [Nitrospirales bacterium]
MIPSSPSVAIIILNFNKRADVLEAINSALAVEYPHVYVVVVDNASTDGSWEAIADTYQDLSTIRMPTNVGAAGGRNAGWRYVNKHFQTEYLFFLDDDAVIAPDAIECFMHAIQHDQTVGIACGKSYTRFPSTTINSAGIRVNMYTGIINDIGAGEEDRKQYNESRYVDACGCFGLLIRATLFERLNGFNEMFNPYGWEDVDLCLRSKRLGYKTRYVPTAVIHHKGTKVGRKPLPKYEQTKARNYLYLIRDHATVIQLVCIGLCFPFRLLALMAKLIRHGDAHILASHARGAWHAILMPNKSDPFSKEIQ